MYGLHRYFVVTSSLSTKCCFVLVLVAHAYANELLINRLEFRSIRRESAALPRPISTRVMETVFVQVFSFIFLLFVSTTKKKHDIGTDNNVLPIRIDRPLRPYRDKHIPRPLPIDPPIRIRSRIVSCPPSHDLLGGVLVVIYTLGNRIVHVSFCFTSPTEPFFSIFLSMF